MLILNLEQATHHAANFLKYDTLVVGEKGCISAECDVDAICKVHESKGEKFFIVKGERKIKEIKKVKVKENGSEIK